MSRILAQVRDELYKHFVTSHLGPQTLTRDLWLTHNSVIAHNLFDATNNQLILVADGTYCYCQRVPTTIFNGKLGVFTKVAI